MVHLHHQPELVERHLREGLVAQHAGVADEDVDASPIADRPRHQCLHLREIGDVAAVGDGLPARARDLVDDTSARRTRLRSGHIVDHHPRAVTRERQRMGTAQTGARAGDDGHAAFQKLVHGDS